MGRRDAAGFVKRLSIVVFGLAVLFLLPSCGHRSREYLPRSVSDSRLQSRPGDSVAGYTTADSTRHTFEGRAWVEGDSMVFERPARNHGMEEPQPTMRTRVALTDLASVDVIETDKKRSTVFTTTNMITAGLALVAIVFLLIHGD